MAEADAVPVTEAGNPAFGVTPAVTVEPRRSAGWLSGHAAMTGMSDEVNSRPPDPAQAPRTPARTSPPRRSRPPREPDGAPRGQGLNHMVISAITEGSPAVVTTLAILLALVIGGLLIAFSDTAVLHAWNTFFSAPGAAISAAWDSVAAAYSAMFEGAILNPHTVAAAFHGGSVGAIFYPLSQTASDATPLDPHRAVGGHSPSGPACSTSAPPASGSAARSWPPTWGSRVSLPPVIHVIVCLIGGFAGGAVIGWIVGELKARTGAHEVIVTIMLNYVMYNFLSYLLGTPDGAAAARPVEPDQPASGGHARLPHVGGPPPQVDAGFLIALAAAAGVWWLLARSHHRVPVPHGGRQPERGPQLRDERRGDLGPRDADRRGAGGPGGRRGHPRAVHSPQLQQLRHVRLRPASPSRLLGRASPLGVVLAALLFGALHAGARSMEAATQVPASLVQVLQGLIVLFVAAPPLIRAMFRLREAKAAGLEAVPKGWNA